MKNILSDKKNFLSVLCFIVCAIVLVSSCMKENELVVNGAAPEPKLPAQPYNYSTGDDDLATLGRVLFYDRNLSLNNAISCGSCHKQQFAFADNNQFSTGLNNGLTSRNASTVLSSPNHNKFWDGRAGNMDTAVFMPVMNQLEMHIFNLNMLPDRLSKLSYYPELFENAYGDSEINVYRIRTALSLFVTNLYSFNSKFDLSWSGGPPLSALELQGEDIFQGKARCYACHNSSNFNGYSTIYANIGLEVNYADKGRGNITHNNLHDGKFAVQTLRNIELTSPYMHDGRYKTMREVIDHYDSGILDSRNLSYVFRDIPSQILDTLIEEDGDFTSFPVAKLNLTENEKQALEAFLKTLTDVNFITDPRYSNPF